MRSFRYRVRLRGTHIEGTVYASLTEGTETFYYVNWDADMSGDSERYRAQDLESADRRESLASHHYDTYEACDRRTIEANRAQRLAEGGELDFPKYRTGNERR